MSIGLVILAAGASTRLGEPKQLLVFDGKTLLQHAVDTALSLESGPVVVVLGAHAGKISQSLGESSAWLVKNPDWSDGMGGSLRLGLKTVLEVMPEISAAIFLVCDQPFLSSKTLHDLIVAHETGDCAIAAAEYHATLGVPALFDRRIFPELLTLSGADGARQIIHRHRSEVIGVPFSEGAYDIDTPDDFSLLQQFERLPV